MLRLLTSSSGLSLPSLLLLLVLTSTAGCSNPALSLLTGGGPNVAANTQIGKTNTQTLGTTELSSNSFDVKEAEDIVVNQDKQDVKTGAVDGDVKITNVEPWFILFALLGWIAPSPQQIGQSIGRLFTRKKK